MLVLAALAPTVALVTLRLLPHASLSSQVPLSRAVYARGGELLRVTLASDEQIRLWTPLSQISPLAVQATLLYEDRWFRVHPGINPVALGRAVQSIVSGGRRIGGSTITMQLARRLYDIDSRRPWGKVQQLVAALWLEARHSKDEILEAYLNLVPFGGNVEGIGAASLVHFGTECLGIGDGGGKRRKRQRLGYFCNVFRGLPQIHEPRPQCLDDRRAATNLNLPVSFHAFAPKHPPESGSPQLRPSEYRRHCREKDRRNGHHAASLQNESRGS